MSYRVTLSNSGGELDGRFAATEDDIKGALFALISDIASFHDGDKIEITEVRTTPKK